MDPDLSTLLPEAVLSTWPGRPPMLCPGLCWETPATARPPCAEEQARSQGGLGVGLAMSSVQEPCREGMDGHVAVLCPRCSWVGFR